MQQQISRKNLRDTEEITPLYHRIPGMNESHEANEQQSMMAFTESNSQGNGHN